MSVIKVDKYYLSDLQWYIIKNYPNARNSGIYAIIKDSFEDFNIPKDEFEQTMSLGILNSIKEDLELKKKKLGTDDPRRILEATRCLVMIDMVSQNG